MQRCRFSDKAPPPEDDSGVLITLWIDEDSQAGYNTRILNNQFLRYNEGQDHLGNGFETIRVGTHGKWDVPTKVLIEGNYFYRMDAEHPDPGRANLRSNFLCVVFFGTMMILRGSLLTQGVTSSSRAWSP